MTPEQRAQLQALSDQLLKDMDLRWQMDQLENLMKNASTSAALAEADMDRVLEEAGLIEQKEGRLELTPRGLREIGANALRDLFGKLAVDSIGQHQVNRLGIGHERTYDTKSYEYGDSFQLDLQRTLCNTLHRSGPGVPVKLSPEDFEIERTEHLTRSSTVLMLDPSMPMLDNFLPAKKVAMALHSLISTQFPRDYLGIVGFGEAARELKAKQLPEVSWDFVYGTNMHHAFTLSRRLLDRQSGTKQIIMITDGEPTAHITSAGDVFFNYPPVRETVEAGPFLHPRTPLTTMCLSTFLNTNGNSREVNRVLMTGRGPNVGSSPRRRAS